MIAVAHHDRGVWSRTECAFAVAVEQQHAVTVVSTDSEIEFAVEVHISEGDLVRRMRHGDRVSGGGKLSAALSEQHGDGAIPCARRDEVRLTIIVDVADDHVTGATGNRERRTRTEKRVLRVNIVGVARLARGKRRG